jgi:asparagine synthetase B (glutamine-hydrolysing)
MCGICGIAILERFQHAVDEARLLRIRDTLVHRGTYGAGLLSDGAPNGVDDLVDWMQNVDRTAKFA